MEIMSRKQSPSSIERSLFCLPFYFSLSPRIVVATMQNNSILCIDYFIIAFCYEFFFLYCFLIQRLCDASDNVFNGLMFVRQNNNILYMQSAGYTAGGTQLLFSQLYITIIISLANRQNRTEFVIEPNALFIYIFFQYSCKSNIHESMQHIVLLAKHHQFSNECMSASAFWIFFFHFTLYSVQLLFYFCAQKTRTDELFFHYWINFQNKRMVKSKIDEKKCLKRIDSYINCVPGYVFVYSIQPQRSISLRNCVRCSSINESTFSLWF